MSTLFLTVAMTAIGGMLSAFLAGSFMLLTESRRNALLPHLVSFATGALSTALATTAFGVAGFAAGAAALAAATGFFDGFTAALGAALATGLDWATFFDAGFDGTWLFTLVVLLDFG